MGLSELQTVLSLTRGRRITAAEASGMADKLLKAANSKYDRAAL